jgi:hypothetical protein
MNQPGNLNEVVNAIAPSQQLTEQDKRRPDAAQLRCWDRLWKILLCDDRHAMSSDTTAAVSESKTP